MAMKMSVVVGCVLLAPLLLIGCSSKKNGEEVIPQLFSESETQDSQWYAKARLDGDEVFLSLNKELWEDYLYANTKPELSEEAYAVKGFEGKCIGIHLDTLKGDLTPVLFLVMENGDLEYLAIESALLSPSFDGEIFYSMGVLPEVKNVASFEVKFPGDEGNDGIYAPGNRNLTAVDLQGNEFDMTVIVRDHMKAGK